MTSLQGLVTVVTGGNRGIGLGLAEGIALAGGDVAIWARKEGRSEEAVARLQELVPGGRFVAIRCDVSDPREPPAACAATVEALGRIDSCIANAGTSNAAPFLEMSHREWRRVLRTNLDGAFFTLQAVAKQIVAQGTNGALVVVSSTSAIHGAPVNAHYAASKAGGVALARSAAVALARHNIRVNALLPGWTLTELSQVPYDNEQFREATIKRTPVRRWADPAEFREIGAYLCDPTHQFHTGDSIVMDGGYTAH